MCETSSYSYECYLCDEQYFVEDVHMLKLYIATMLSQ